MPAKQDLKPLLSIRQNQLSLTFSASDTLDNKNLGLLAVNVALLIFAAQLNGQTNPWGLLLASALFIASFLCNVVAVWSRDYIGNVDLNKHPEYLSMEPKQLVLQLLADTEAAINVNSYFNEVKWKLCAASLILSVVGAGILTWCIL